MSEPSEIGKKRHKRLMLGVGIPSGENWEARFGLDLAIMCTHTQMNWLGPDVAEQRLHIMSSRSSMLSRNRESIVQMARKNKCEYLLCLDCDMVFPKDTLHRLYAHQKDFVAANCVTKTIPATPTATGLDGNKIYTEADSEGLERVQSVGVAVALLKMSIFEGLERPWFPMQWSEELKNYIAEDIFFCRKLQSRGIEMWIDHDLSKEVKHTGRMDYSHAMAEEFSTQDWENAVA